jgi:hypothetical protein
LSITDSLFWPLISSQYCLKYNFITTKCVSNNIALKFVKQFLLKHSYINLALSKWNLIHTNLYQLKSKFGLKHYKKIWWIWCHVQCNSQVIGKNIINNLLTGRHGTHTMKESAKHKGFAKQRVWIYQQSHESLLVLSTRKI